MSVKTARMSLGAFALVVASGALFRARAEPQHCPLMDDDWKSFDSPNKRFFAAAGPKERSTIVFHRVGPSPGVIEKIWEMPGWLGPSFLSDDGDYLVWCRGGPSGPRRKAEEVMVSIFRRGTLVRAIRLNQILSDPISGPHSTRWAPWGDCKGFVGLHDFSLATLESRRLIYDVTTGELVEAVFVDRGKPASQTTMDDLWDDPPVGRTLHRTER